MRDYRDLRVWCLARTLVGDVYAVTRRFPSDERFGLTAQARRSAVSVAANIAEGTGRRGSAEFRRFVDIAVGSVYELECHLLLAQDLAFVPDETLRPVLSEIDEVKRMLIALSQSLAT